MKVAWYRIGKKKRLVPIPDPFSMEKLAEYTDPVWVDVESSDTGELITLLDRLEPNRLVRESILESPTGTRLLPFDNELYAQFSIPATDEATRLAYLSVIVRTDLVVTIHMEPIPDLEQVGASFAEHMSMHAYAPAPVLYHIIDYMIDRLVASVMKVRDHINTFADQLDDPDTDLDQGDILEVKRWISRLGVTAEDILYCIGVLQSSEPEAFRFSGSRMILRDLFGQAEYVLRRINRFEIRLQDLNMQMHSNLQTQTESRLRVLTVISAIFQPLALITGLYGMNFVIMPELQWRFGYLYALGLMVVVSGSLLLFFRKRGWFH